MVLLSCLLLCAQANATIFRWMTYHTGAPTAVGIFNYAGWEHASINRQNLPATGGGNSYELGIAANGHVVNKPSLTTFGAGSILRNFYAGYHTSGFNVGWLGNINNSGVFGIYTRDFSYIAGYTFNHYGTIALSSNGSFTNAGTFNAGTGASITGDSSTLYTNNDTFDVYAATTCTSRFTNNGLMRLRTGNFTKNSQIMQQSQAGTLRIWSGNTFLGNARFDNYGTIEVNSGGVLAGAGLMQNLGGFASLTINGTYSRTGALNNLKQASGTPLIYVNGGSITFPAAGNALNNTGNIRLLNATAVFPSVAYINTGTIYIDGNNTVSGTISGIGNAELFFGNYSACTGNIGATIDIPDIYITRAGTSPTFTQPVTATTLLYLQNSGSATFNNALTVGGNLLIGSASTLTKGTGDLIPSGSLNMYNNGTFIHTGGDFRPTYFENNGTATLTNTNCRPANTVNYGTLNINGTTPINGSITNSGTGVLTLGGTSHIIGAAVTITNDSTTANGLTINVPTTLSGSIVNNQSFSLQGALTNGTITNNGTTTINANVAGTGTFTNNSSVEHLSGTVAATKTVNNASNWYLRAGSSPIIASTAFTNTSTGYLQAESGSTISGTISNFGIINLYAGSTMSGTINAQTDSIIEAQGSFTQSGAITGAGGNTGSVLSLNVSNADTQTTGAAITDIRGINVNKGTFSIVHAVSGISDQFIIYSGATATVTGVLLNGSGSILNQGSLQFNAGSTLTGFDFLRTNSGAVTTFASGAAFSISGIDLLGPSTLIGGTLSITSGTTLQTNSAINLINTINIIGSSQLTLQNGASCTNFASINLESGSTIQIDNGASLTVSDAHTLSGDGDVVNSGFFTVDDANVTLGSGGVGGDFTNQNTGVFYINGTPTITLQGANFINRGSIFASFSIENQLPSINASAATNVDLTDGSIVVGYNNNYISSGEYTLLTSNAPITVADIGGYVLPQPSRYISAWSLSTNGANVNVQVTRDGFGNHATTSRGKEIGDFMELLGTSSPTQEQLNLLNALEKIDNDSDLNAALVSLFPSESPPIQTMQMIDTSLHQVEMRLVNTRQDTLMAAAGDNDLYGRHGVWIRPFTSYGHQRDKQELSGYKAKTKGIAFGIDTQAQHWLTVGIAGSASKSTVTQNSNALTYTDISVYQAMVYGTYIAANNSYVDWILAVGNNNYDGVRNVSLPGFEANAVSDYGGQQLTAKVIASRDFELFDYYQLTPQGSAQYSFLRTLAYQENGAGPFNVSVSPNNMNLFRLGVGAELAVPLSDRNFVGIPSIHAGAYVDAGGGAQDTNSMFISGGPIISSTLQPNRLLIKVGASFNLSINDNLEFTANYDLESRRGYTGHEAYINLRYIF